MIEIKQNCAGYALHQVGINPEETPVDPKYLNWSDYFSEVRTPEEADAVIVIKTQDYEEAELVHIAVIDQKDKGIIHHRRKLGADVTTETLNVFLMEFWNPIFDVVYVKRRT